MESTEPTNAVPSENIAHTMEAATAAVQAEGDQELDDRLDAATSAEPEMEVDYEASEGEPEPDAEIDSIEDYPEEILTNFNPTRGMLFCSVFA